MESGGGSQGGCVLCAIGVVPEGVVVNSGGMVAGGGICDGVSVGEGSSGDLLYGCGGILYMPYVPGARGKVIVLW